MIIDAFGPGLKISKVERFGRSPIRQERFMPTLCILIVVVLIHSSTNLQALKKNQCFLLCLRKWTLWL